MQFDPNDLHFYGHDTFPLRHLWLPKAVNHVRKHNNLSDYDKIMVEQGLGKNMAKSLRHWAESAQIIERKDHKKMEDGLTWRGEVIFSNEGDQYLQFTDTIWLIHYLIVTNHNKNALWYYLFNEYSEKEFSKDKIFNSMISWLKKIGRKDITTEKQLLRDFQCCMNMYCYRDKLFSKKPEDYFSSPFAQLKLITKENDNYSFRSVNHKEISDDLFAYCLLDYLRGSENNKAVPFSEILYGPKSPGKVFILSENSLVQKLEQFVNNYSEYFEFESTAGMSTLFELKDLQVEMKDLLNNIFINAS